MTLPNPESAPDRIYTYEEIEIMALGLRPLDAARVQGAQRERLCVTPLITRMLWKGEIVSLGLDEAGRFGAGYLRVSTEAQRGQKYLQHLDGFSEPDQISHLVGYFIGLGRAFRLYSDCGISGAYPPDEPGLRQSMWQKRASVYREIFTAVMLDEYVTRYSTEQKAAARAAMEATVTQILKSGKTDDDVAVEADTISDKEIVEAETGITDTAAAVDSDAVTEAERATLAASHNRKRATRSRNTTSIRPAITLLMRDLGRICTVAVTDMSRLSRRASFTIVLCDRMDARDVELVGLIQRIQSRKEAHGELMTYIQAYANEMKLREVCMNSLRGILQRLESGRPHSKPPQWLCLNDRGFGEFKRDEDGQEAKEVRAIRRMLKLYLDDEEVGMKVVSTKLWEEGYKPPMSTEEHGNDKRWAPTSMRQLLTDPALIGKQNVFGLDWDVYPALINDDTWWRLRRKIIRRGEEHDFHEPHHSYLGTSLMRCPCGSSVSFRGPGKSLPDGSYLCTAMRHGTHDRSVSHIMIRATEMDRFLTDLVEQHPQVMYRAVESGEATRYFEEEWEALHSGLQQLRETLAREERDAREDAKSALALASVPPHDESYERLVHSIVDTKTRSRHAEVLTMEERIAVKRSQMSSYVPPEQDVPLGKRLEAWRGMNTKERNALLRALIAEIGFSDDLTVAHLRLHGAPAPLYPIRLLITRRGFGTTRRMPSVDDWIASSMED